MSLIDATPHWGGLNQIWTGENSCFPSIRTFRDNLLKYFICYRYKQDELFHEEVMLPVNAPPKYADREKREKTADAIGSVENEMIHRRNG